MLKTLSKMASAADLNGMLAVAEIIDHLLVLGSEINPPYSSEEALIIADAIGIDFDHADFNIHQFKIGLEAEMEHASTDSETNVIGHNRLALGKIVWAHLKEDPHYYTKLRQIEP